MNKFRLLIGAVTLAFAIVSCGDEAGRSTCGNGSLDEGEQCDDGNRLNDDGCSALCTSEPSDAEGACGDGRDDDGDGLVDCQDPDCATDTACAAEDCGNGVDDDGDTDVDCDDSDCSGAAECAAAVEDCDNEVDDDGDEAVDCDDPDCATDTACSAAVEDCANDLDDDEDGATDCDDPDCAASLDCAGACGDGTPDADEECDNGSANSDVTPNACRADCTDPVCGDDVVDTDFDEECDGTEDCDESCQLLPFCGDGEMNQESEQCDNGILNADRVPNACRTDCTNPLCGDEVTDSGEQCDLGSAVNGTGGAACLGNCTWDADVACSGVPDVIDLAVSGAVVGGALRYVGTLVGATDDHSPTAECLAEGVEDGEDVLFIFTPSEAGTYRVTTELAVTSADTILYETRSCGGNPGVCNDDDLPELGSTIFLDNVLANAPTFLVVDAVAGEAGPFGLEIVKVDTVVDAGGDCSAAGAACGAGLRCAELQSGLQCVAPAAPILTSLEVRLLDADSALHRFRGTDVNQDVELTFIQSLLDELGENDGPALFTLTPVWDGETFVADLYLQSTEPSWPWVSIEAEVIDDLLNESNLVMTNYPDLVTAVVGEGAACDLFTLTTICAEGFTCTNGTGGATCVAGDGSAPTLSGVDAERFSDDLVRFRFHGNDPNADVVEWGVDWLNAEGTSVSGPAAEDFTLDPTGMVDFVLESYQTGMDDPSITQADVWLVDANDQKSSTVRVTIAPFGNTSEDGVCTFGLGRNDCEAGLVCSADGFGGGVCAEPEPPFITDVDAVVSEDGSSIFVTITGGDPNGDVLFADFIVTDPNGASYFLLSDFLGSDDLYPGPFGRLNFVVETPPLPTYDVIWESISVALYDGFFDSGWVTDSLREEHGLGGACAEDGSTGVCADELDLVCVATVCEAAADFGGSCDDTDTYCAVGLTCDTGDTDVCIEAEAPCGPDLTVLEVSAGTEVDEGTLVSFDTTDLGNYSVPATRGCSDYGFGGEVVSRFQAPVDEDGRLTASTVDLTDVDTLLYARINQCLDRQAEVACNEDTAGTFQSTIELDLDASDVAYVFIDGYFAGDEGAGQALFTFRPYRDAGEGCDYDELAVLCRGGLICGFESACGADDACCETAQAPTLTDVTATFPDEVTTDLELTGGDVNGDIVSARLNFFDVGDTEVGSALTLTFEPGRVDSFTDAPLAVGSVAARVAAGAVRFTVVLTDETGLVSDPPIGVDLPVVVSESGDCPPDVGDADPVEFGNWLCEDGTACVDDVCTTTTPSLTAVTITYNEVDPRLIDIVVTGTDADEDVTGSEALFNLTFLDGSESTVLSRDFLISEGSITYDDPADHDFKFETQLRWTASAFYGVDHGQATVTDAAAQTSAPASDYSFAPLRIESETCDLRTGESPTEVCTVGLACTGTEGAETCTEPALADRCGTGLTVEDVDAITPTDVFVWDWDTTIPAATDSLESGSCAVEGQASGAEVVGRWTAPGNGRLVAEVDSSGIDTLLFLRNGLCSDEDSELACNDDISEANALSRLETDVAVDDEHFLFVDTYGTQSDAVSVVLTFGLADGESCDSTGVLDRCDEDLWCDPTIGGGTCASLASAFTTSMDPLDITTCLGGTATFDAGPALRVIEINERTGDNVTYSASDITIEVDPGDRFPEVDATAGDDDFDLDLAAEGQMDVTASVSADLGGGVLALEIVWAPADDLDNLQTLEFDIDITDASPCD